MASQPTPKKAEAPSVEANTGTVIVAKKFPDKNLAALGVTEARSNSEGQINGVDPGADYFLVKKVPGVTVSPNFSATLGQKNELTRRSVTISVIESTPTE